MASRRSRVTLLVVAALLASAAPRVVRADPPAQKLLAADREFNDEHGLDVAIDGDIAVVGAIYDRVGGPMIGSATVHRRVGGVWVEEQQLVASDAVPADYFGIAVAVQGDRIVVGASEWQENFVVTGAAYVFEWSGASWVEVQKIVPPDEVTDVPRYGYSVEISGDVLLVGGYGAAWIYRHDGASYQPEQQLVASELQDYWYGRWAGLEGDLAVVGGSGESIYAFQWNGSAWVEVQIVEPPAPELNFGVSAIALDGASLYVSSPPFPPHVFRWNGAAFVHEQTLVPAVPDPSFGGSAALAGNLILVGARGADGVTADTGAAHLFRWDGAAWDEIDRLDPVDGLAGDWFGERVALSQDAAIVGAPRDDDPVAGQNAGSAYVFDVASLVPCSNGLDDDGDGALDASDPGCGSSLGTTEAPACQNGLDDDGDGGIDFDGGAAANGGIPLGPPDSFCITATRMREAPRPGCGLGVELLAVTAALRLLRKDRAA